MKKIPALCGVLVLVAVVFAPSAEACGRIAVQAASGNVRGCPMMGMKARGKGCYVSNTAKHIKKSFNKDEAGNLVYNETGDIYARVQKKGDEVVYVAGDETYTCMYEAASATWDKTYPDEANPFLKIYFDDDGNIVCGPCEIVIAKAKRNDVETIYVVNGKDYDCAYEAFIDAASVCDKCRRGRKACLRRRGRF
ncbi:MAG: hypothetical protein JSV08_01880 [Acidobacteriota bacterium]|nr:MAG: hypothetical protein JSV08_01880 [Acidobacteriota bacterium]